MNRREDMNNMNDAYTECIEETGEPEIFGEEETKSWSSVRWQCILPKMWEEPITFAAVYVDCKHKMVYVHGGKVAHQHDNVSNKMFTFDLNKLLLLYKSNLKPEPSIEKCKYIDENKIAVQECFRELEYIDKDNKESSDEFQKRTKASKEYICPPERYGHILMKHDGELIVHGGKDRYGMVHHSVFTYNLERHAWQRADNFMGGIASPRMYEHTSSILDDRTGLFLILGVVCDIKGSPVKNTSNYCAKKKLQKSSKVYISENSYKYDDMTRIQTKQRELKEHACKGEISAFVACMHPLNRAWHELFIVNYHAGPGPRHQFNLVTHERHFNSDYCESTRLDSLHGLEHLSAFVIGGKCNGKEYRDIWQLTLTYNDDKVKRYDSKSHKRARVAADKSFIWREVKVTLHPEMSAKCIDVMQQLFSSAFNPETLPQRKQYYTIQLIQPCMSSIRANEKCEEEMHEESLESANDIIYNNKSGCNSLQVLHLLAIPRYRMRSHRFQHSLPTIHELKVSRNNANKMNANRNL